MLFFCILHDDYEVYISKLVKDDKMLQYIVYYTMDARTANHVTIKEFSEKLKYVTLEPKIDLISEIFTQIMEWLSKYKPSKHPNITKYIERVLPYTVSKFLNRNRTPIYMSQTEMTEQETETLMSEIDQYEDIRKSIIHFGEKISKKTITDIAKQLNITYRAARYILIKEDK